MKAAYFAHNVPWVNGNVIDCVFAGQRRMLLESLTDMHPVMVSSENLEDEIAKLVDLEVIFSTWGMPALTAARVFGDAGSG
jgi:hypothetical protein